MARVETKRYDVKLDSFLRRTLPSDDYERVSSSEPCVVLSPEDKRAHRHVIVGHRALYLTEFPPKSLKVAVQLKDVHSVKMLEDLPDFLSGKEQEDTVHVQIHYSKPPREGGFARDKSPAVLKKLLSGGSSPPLSTSSLQTAQLAKKHGGSSQSLVSTVSQAQAGVLRKKRSSSLNPISHLDVGQSADHKQNSAMRLRSSRSHTVPAIALDSGSPSPRPKCQLQQQYRHSVLHLADSNSSLKSAASSGLASSTNSVYKASMRADALRLQAAKLHGSTPDFSSLSRSSASTSDDYRSSLSNLASSERGSVASLVATDSAMREPGTGERAVMDLYILKHNTDFYHQLCTTWCNYKIERTLTGDIPVTTSHTSASHEHFSQHFSMLRQELLSASSLEASAQLTQELSTACQKYFVIKRFFWEDSELCEVCTGRLQRQLTTLREHKPTGNKTDDIEYLLILMDLLYQMLRETHLFSKRLVVLTRNSGQLLLSMAKNLVSLLPKYKSGDSQVECFDGELTEKAAAILYELIQVTQQARWPQAAKTTISTAWLFAAISELPATKDLCARLVFYIAAGVGRRSTLLHSEPSTQTQLSLYHAATLLISMATNSPAILELMRSQFKEEFKYFISLTRAREKLPSSGLLSADTLQALHSCKSKVLQTTNNAFSNPIT